MSDKINNADDPKLVSAVLQRMDELTRDQWLERLSWTPEGLEHKQVLPEANLCTAKTSSDGGKTQVGSEKKNPLALITNPAGILRILHKRTHTR